MSLWLSDAKCTNILVNLDHVMVVERREIPGPKKDSPSTFSLVATMTDGKEVVVESGMTKDTIGSKIRGVKATIEGSMKILKEALQEHADKGEA